jgi:hypothetical protein
MPSSVISSQCESVCGENENGIRRAAWTSKLKVEVQVSLSLDSLAPSARESDRLSGCTPLDPFAPNICNSTKEKKRNVRLSYCHGCAAGRFYLSQRLKTHVSELMASGYLERAKIRIVVGQCHQRRIGEFSAFADTQLT